jgi:uncharacterized protein YbcV (DUF1398 family)
MNESVRQAIERCARSSKDGSAHFPQIVAALVQAGVESYFADYRADATTYYLPGGGTHAVALPPPDVTIADAFDAAGVQAAIRGAQSGRVMYPEFLRLSRAAGCVGYVVWLAGRHVAYFGRRGETHVEHFPAAMP